MFRSPSQRTCLLGAPEKKIEKKALGFVSKPPEEEKKWHAYLGFVSKLGSLSQKERAKLICELCHGFWRVA